MKKIDSFQSVLDSVRQVGSIESFAEADRSGVLSIEIDGNVDCTDFLAVRKLEDGSEFDATCILKVEFMPTSKNVHYWGYEVALDLLFSHYGLGYTKISRVDHFLEHMLYRFLHISQGRNRLKAIYGIAVCSGPSYVKRNSKEILPSLAEIEKFSKLFEFYKNSQSEFGNCREEPLQKKRFELQNIIYTRQSQ